MHNSFLKIWTHLVLSVTSHDFFSPLVRYIWQWMRQKKVTIFIQTSVQTIQILSFPRIKTHCKMLQQSFKQVNLEQQNIILCIISKRFQKPIKYLYFFYYLSNHIWISKQFLELSRYKSLSSALELMLFKEHLSPIKLTVLNNYWTFPTII